MSYDREDDRPSDTERRTDGPIPGEPFRMIGNYAVYDEIDLSKYNRPTRMDWRWYLDWSRWLIGVDFIIFPTWGSAHFGPVSLDWSEIVVRPTDDE